MTLVPPRIAKQRSMAFGSVFSFCIGAAFFILVYYIPIWFQAIKNTSTTQSGIDSLPLILAQALGTVIAGILTTQIGHYMPFVMLSVIFLSVGAGLITTFHVDTPAHIWIGYQIIFGLGSGFGFQQMTVAAQTILPTPDVPTGTAVVMFVQLLGGSIFVTVAENLFTNKLLSGIVQQVPDLNPSTISSAGATGLRGVVPSQYLEQVLVVYNEALVKTFQVALIMSCLTLLGAVGVEWRSVKGKELTPMAA
jgi:MFS family permease